MDGKGEEEKGGEGKGGEGKEGALLKKLAVSSQNWVCVEYTLACTLDKLLS